MAGPFSLDTSVCVSLLRLPRVKIPAELQQLMDVKTTISSVVLGELETGVQKSPQPELPRRLLQYFLEHIAVLDFDAGAARHYGEIRAYLESRGTPIGPLDQLIAAHARSLGLTLLTFNLREFKRVPDLRCEGWVARAQA